jgi:hypothetical protein
LKKLRRKSRRWDPKTKIPEIRNGEADPNPEKTETVTEIETEKRDQDLLVIEKTETVVTETVTGKRTETGIKINTSPAVPDLSQKVESTMFLMIMLHGYQDVVNLLYGGIIPQLVLNILHHYNIKPCKPLVKSLPI